MLHQLEIKDRLLEIMVSQFLSFFVTHKCQHFFSANLLVSGQTQCSFELRPSHAMRLTSPVVFLLLDDLIKSVSKDFKVFRIVHLLYDSAPHPVLHSRILDSIHHPCDLCLRLERVFIFQQNFEKRL